MCLRNFLLHSKCESHLFYLWCFCFTCESWLIKFRWDSLPQTSFVGMVFQVLGPMKFPKSHPLWSKREQPNNHTLSSFPIKVAEPLRKAFSLKKPDGSEGVPKFPRSLVIQWYLDCEAEKWQGWPNDQCLSLLRFTESDVIFRDFISLMGGACYLYWMCRLNEHAETTALNFFTCRSSSASLGYVTASSFVELPITFNGQLPKILQSKSSGGWQLFGIVGNIGPLWSFFMTIWRCIDEL